MKRLSGKKEFHTYRAPAFASSARGIRMALIKRGGLDLSSWSPELFREPEPSIVFSTNRNH